jgi:hypothetical protein
MMAATATRFDPTDALTSLLTVESLLFAVFSITLTFGSSGLTKNVTGGTMRRLARATAAVLTVLSIGAGTSWVTLFVGSSTHGFAQWSPAVALAIGVIAQPVFAWIFVANL